MIFGIKYIFFAIATNIPVLLMTGFVVQCLKYPNNKHNVVLCALTNILLRQVLDGSSRLL